MSNIVPHDATNIFNTKKNFLQISSFDHVIIIQKQGK